MLFDSIMHVTFYCEDLKRSVAFYEDLGCQIKMAVKYKSYLNRPDHPFYQKALDTPDDYCIVYMEVAPGQFIELFPKKKGQSKHISFDEDTGYSHFGTLVKDISATRDFLVSKGVKILSGPKIGNSHTWQMWIADPDDNRIEIMQYTDESYQVTGHIDE